MDTNLINGLINLTLREAQIQSMDLVKNLKCKILKKQRLLMDIQSAGTSNEVCKIMWNVYLSGDGLSTVGSKWQKQYG